MLLQDPNYSASCLLLLYLAIIYCNATFCNLFGKKCLQYKITAKYYIYSNRRFKMDFTTIVLVVIVAVVAYTLFKAFSKKESVIEAVKEEIAEVKAVETKAVAEVKVVATKAKATATKAKATVKKATTRPAKKAPAKK